MQTVTADAGRRRLSGGPAGAHPAKTGAVLRVTSGNFLEQFDFFRFGFCATCVAFVPGCAQIGLLAPLPVLVGRLLQGFSAGAELGGVSVCLADHPVRVSRA